LDEQVCDQLEQLTRWSVMLRAEPELAALRRRVLRTAREWSRGRKAEWPFCARKTMLGEIVPQLSRLVGRKRRREPLWLCQPLAFNTAYLHLYALRPSCRRCSCPSVAEVLDDLFSPR
jgi:hypothetical protein